MPHEPLSWLVVVAIMATKNRRVPEHDSGERHRQILGELQKLNKKFDALDHKFDALAGTVGALTNSVGALAESKLRNDAAKKHGKSYATAMVVSSLIDIVHFASKEDHGYLKKLDNESRVKAFACLVATADTWKVPVVRAFVRGVNEIVRSNDDVCCTLHSILDKLGQHPCNMEPCNMEPCNMKNPLNVLSSAVDIAEGSLDNSDCVKVLKLLRRACGILNESMPQNVVQAINRLEKAFKDPDNFDNPNLKTRDGPGVMLLHIASKFEDPNALEEENTIFKHLNEELQFDMRGRVTWNDDGNVTIECAEAKSSSNGVSKAKKQIVTRARFLRTAMKSMFPGTSTFTMKGEIYVLNDAGKHARGFDYQGVSIKIVPNH